MAIAFRMEVQKKSCDSMAILRALGYDDRIAAPRTPGCAGAISPIHCESGLSEPPVTQGRGPNEVQTAADRKVASTQDRHRFDGRWQNQLKGNRAHRFPPQN